MDHLKINVYITIIFGFYCLTHDSFVNSPKTILSKDEEEENKILSESNTCMSLYCTYINTCLKC